MTKDMTDGEAYEMLKKIKSDNLIDAEQWKGLRLIQLSKEGKVWSK